MAREGAKMFYKNAKPSEQTTNTGAKLVEARAAGSTIRGLVNAVDRLATALNGLSVNTGTVVKKLAIKSF